MYRVARVALLVLSLSTASCATVTGAAAGPVTGPLHLQENTNGLEPWFYPIAYPLSLPFGVLAGAVTGAAADWGFLVSGFEYGAEGHPPFSAVWNPMAPEWGGYRPQGILEQYGAVTVDTR